MARRSLGNNRPRSGYGAEGRRIAQSLARHAALMAKLINDGMNKADASREALRQMRVIR